MKKTIAIIVVAVALGILLGTLEGSSDPRFCGSCHEMEPYVRGWSESAHKTVTCIDCHFEPGIENYIKGKLGATKYLVKHFTQEEFDPQAVVPDSTCLHCHSGLRSNKNLRMDHSMVTEMKAACSDCHELRHSFPFASQ
jgi:nitrate/TMAO reductase-like tetraheme cytochrome c subunit